MGISVFPAPSTSSSATQQWTQIGAYTSTTNVSTIDFNNIPQTYRALRLVINGIVKQTTDDQLYMRFNSNSGNNYAWWGWYATGTTYLSTYRYVDQTVMTLSSPGTNINVSRYFMATIDIVNYAEVNAAKQVSFKSQWQEAGYYYNETVSGNWNTGASTPAITSINLIAGSGNMNIIGSNSNGIFLYGGN